MAGRPAKTAAEHLLAGTKSQAKPVTASPIVGGRPHCPQHLSPVARKEFKRCCKLMEARKVLTPGDVALLSVYSEVWARWLKAKAEIGDSLMVYVTVLGHNGESIEKMILNPLLKIVQACETRLQAIAKELSLTPISRDKARPTSTEAIADIVPGSVRETHPELFVMPSPNDLALQDAAEDNEQ